MSTNAAQQISGTRLSPAAGVVTSPGRAPDRSVMASALATPVTLTDRAAARVQLAQASSRLGPGGDRRERDFSAAIGIGPGGVHGGVVVTPPGVPAYGYPPVVVQPPWYQRWSPWYTPVPVYPVPVPTYPPGYGYPSHYHRCGFFEYLITSDSFSRHGRYWCR